MHASSLGDIYLAHYFN